MTEAQVFHGEEDVIAYLSQNGIKIGETQFQFNVAWGVSLPFLHGTGADVQPVCNYMVEKVYPGADDTEDEGIWIVHIVDEDCGLDPIDIELNTFVTLLQPDGPITTEI